MEERRVVEDLSEYIGGVLEKEFGGKFSNLCDLKNRGEMTRFFSRGSVAALPESLEAWFAKAATELREDVEKQFPGFPHGSALDKTNINTMINLFKDHCIADTKDLREVLNTMLDNSDDIKDIAIREACIRNLCTACLTKIGQKCRAIFDKEMLYAVESPEKQQLVMFNQLLTLMTSATLDKDFEQFFSRSADEIRNDVFTKMSDTDKVKQNNAGLIAITNQTTPPQRPPSLFQAKAMPGAPVDDKRNRPERKTKVMPDTTVDDKRNYPQRRPKQ